MVDGTNSGISGKPDALAVKPSELPTPREQIAAVRATSDELQRESEGSRQHVRQQGWIAICVISLYVGTIGAAALGYIVAAWGGANGQALAYAAGQIRDMTNTLVLPVVTLVLGYYFGRRTE